ncbi:Peroxiredoxin [Bernardetia litoralis DSM 6794]|uniref:Peroxiredoxin n=1 Tax=Bernardetia litoralis (strain ATCC 23117 / DSM 6794 / NBRC 15988 / NCIMB 1366 / Fx l1 / Sio-4) TaxID=880071 RepID=I4AM84_BERLS|nr:TlpA disulfide reductase family protein [Bernardetia litoralis]AFM05069.1 Peroxiredoxin [Bernardetia litoralis DSM 6794]
MKKYIFAILLLSNCLVIFAQDSVELEVLTKESYYETSLGRQCQEKMDTLLNTQATDFKFRTLKGDSVKLSDLKGKVVLFTTMFRICGPCMREISFINKLNEHYQNKDVVFIVISHHDTPEDFLALQKYLENPKEGKEFREGKYNDKVKVIPASYLGKSGDGYYKDDRVSKEYKNVTKDFLKEYYLTEAAPKSYFIDKKGVIRFITSGYSQHIYDYFPLYTGEIDALLEE